MQLENLYENREKNKQTRTVSPLRDAGLQTVPLFFLIHQARRARSSLLHSRF